MTNRTNLEELPGLVENIRRTETALHSGAMIYEEDAQALGRAADTLESLAAEVVRLREALQFYADEWEQDVDAERTPFGWESTGPLGDIEPTAQLREDRGNIARKALSGGSAG